MSSVMSKYLSYLFGKGVGMTDREANAWAEREAAERDLEHEKAKVRWLCERLANICDGRHHDLEAGKTAEQWEMLAELFIDVDRQRGEECQKK